MKTWLIYALLATLAWGGYIVVAKIATAREYCGLSARSSAALMYLGIGAVFALAWPLMGGAGASRPTGAGPMAAGIGAGVLWALGMLFALLAIKAGADIARLTPIYNCNTLVAVLLAVMLLGELREPRDLARVAAGAALIVGGGVLVAR